MLNLAIRTATETNQALLLQQTKLL